MSALTRLVAGAAVAVAVALAICSSALVTPAAAATPGQVNPLAGLRPLTIVTAPPIAGVKVVLNDVTHTTGRDGTIHTVITKQQRTALAANRDAHLAMSTRQVALSSGARARFHGWFDGGYHFSRNDRSGQIEVAAFDVDYLTSFAFVDSRRAAVDRRRVTGVQLKDTLGATIKTRGATPVWLRGRYVVAAGGRVTVKNLEYRFSTVTVSGANVVTSGEQRFLPSQDSRIRVALRLFTVDFRVRDAVFGRPTGSAIDIEMQDGTTQHRVLSHGSVTVAGLPSGQYRVRIHARGLGAKQTLAISSDQIADVKIIDPVDIALALAVVALIGGGLVFAGRRARRRNHLRPGGGGAPINGEARSAPTTSVATIGRDPR